MSIVRPQSPYPPQKPTEIVGTVGLNDPTVIPLGAQGAGGQPVNKQPNLVQPVVKPKWTGIVGMGSLLTTTHDPQVYKDRSKQFDDAYYSAVRRRNNQPSDDDRVNWYNKIRTTLDSMDPVESLGAMKAFLTAGDKLEKVGWVSDLTGSNPEDWTVEQNGQTYVSKELNNISSFVSRLYNMRAAKTEYSKQETESKKSNLELKKLENEVPVYDNGIPKNQAAYDEYTKNLKGQTDVFSKKMEHINKEADFKYNTAKQKIDNQISLLTVDKDKLEVGIKAANSILADKRLEKIADPTGNYGLNAAFMSNENKKLYNDALNARKYLENAQPQYNQLFDKLKVLKSQMPDQESIRQQTYQQYNITSDTLDNYNQTTSLLAGENNKKTTTTKVQTPSVKQEDPRIEKVKSNPKFKKMGKQQQQKMIEEAKRRLGIK